MRQRMDQPGKDKMAAPASDPESASEGVAAPGPFLRQAEVTTAHPHPRTRSTHFPFLSLPAEVRVMIYGYLLVLPDKGSIRIVPKDEGPMFSNPSAHRDSNVFRNQTLNILMVNKLIYAEAAKEFYSGTHFNFGRGRFANGPILACQTFLIGLSPNMLACIKSIEIVISMPFPFQPCLNEDVFRTLINILNFFLPAFDHLTLNFYGTSYRSYDLDNEDEELGLSDTEDWDLSDDGDRDSLNGEDLSGIRTTFTRDENYLETYAQPPGQP
ncbi:hypothetical protein UCDDS831_g03175 [Diplodia seriata]|uniref:Uncharacterized protein n=1 Tax=Diplodia seriata TaxID=420778 RepID=A0A0G2H2N6_9PEZI|nr:hypothetical protein UCDDS831_g03175 [Diplodia seriata]